MSSTDWEGMAQADWPPIKANTPRTALNIVLSHREGYFVVLIQVNPGNVVSKQGVLRHPRSSFFVDEEVVMSMETVFTISAITAFIAISAICLTLINALSHGALSKLVFRQKARPAVKSAEAAQGKLDEHTYRRAA